MVRPALPEVKDLWEIILEMLRQHDHHTSVAAANGVKPHLSELMRDVLYLLWQEGPMSDEQIEEWPGWEGRLSLTTARRRRTDLVKRDLVCEVGETLNRKGHKVKLWGVIDGSHVPPPQV